jgi:hypothetical protein
MQLDASQIADVIDDIVGESSDMRSNPPSSVKWPRYPWRAAVEMALFTSTVSPALLRGIAADAGSLTDACPGKACCASGRYRLRQVVLGLPKQTAQVMNCQDRQDGVQVAFPFGAALLLDRIGGKGVFRVGPLGAQVQLRAVPAALAARAPRDDAWTDLIGRRTGIRACLDDVGDAALVVEGRTVSGVVYPTHPSESRPTSSRERPRGPKIEVTIPTRRPALRFGPHARVVVRASIAEVSPSTLAEASLRHSRIHRVMTRSCHRRKGAR